MKCQRKQIDNIECKGDGLIHKGKAYYHGKPVCQKCFNNLKFLEKNHGIVAWMFRGKKRDDIKSELYKLE